MSHGAGCFALAGRLSMPQLNRREAHHIHPRELALLAVPQMPVPDYRDSRNDFRGHQAAAHTLVPRHVLIVLDPNQSSGWLRLGANQECFYLRQVQAGPARAVGRFNQRAALIGQLNRIFHTRRLRLRKQ
jgi:hypothetical protein